jgi:hypothetical protein
LEVIQTKDGVRTAYGWASGDQPGIPSFSRTVPAHIAEPIIAAAAMGDAVLFSLEEATHVVGRYRLHAGDCDYFLRVSSIEGHPALERAIVDHLKADHVAANEFLIAGAHFAFEQRPYRLDIRPFLHGTHDLPENGLSALAETVAACHASLRHFPRSHEVQTLARARFTALGEAAKNLFSLVESESWDKIAPHAEWAKHNRVFLAEAADKFDPSLPDAAHAQCQHGQLHRANVLFTASGPVLIDFEESVHVYAPLSWDIAHLVQRFCLHDNPDEQTALARISQIEAHCGTVGHDTFEMMRQIAWFSIIILCDAWRTRALHAPLAEYEKFARLGLQSDSLRTQ